MNDATHTIEISLVDAEGNAHSITGLTVVGRSKDLGIVIDDDQISRRHAQLTPVAEGVEIEDLGSSNGTSLNGKREKKFIACDGDVVGFYVHKFTVSIPSQQKVADVDATRMHVPENTDATRMHVPDAETAVTGAKAEKAGDDADRAWWETSDEGPVNTVLLQPNDMNSSPATSNMMHFGVAENPRLLCATGPLAGKAFNLGEGRFVIGREEECDIRIDNEGISVKHAQIIHEGDTWKLVNLLSSNGTFLNGERVQSAYLNSGDEIRLGPVGFLFQLPGGVAVKSQSKGSAGAAAASGESATQSKKGLVAGLIGFVIVLIVGAVLLL